MTDQAASDQLQSFDSNAMPWGELYIEQLQLGVPLKAFISDPDTCMSVQMIRYDAVHHQQAVRHPLRLRRRARQLGRLEGSAGRPPTT